MAAQQCKAAGIAVTAYMPLAKGKVAEDPTIAEIANRPDCEPALRLRFFWPRDLSLFRHLVIRTG
jgi:diketogulonate reductase-like aldo/keto reductase